jgi:hypothetical protein
MGRSFIRLKSAASILQNVAKKKKHYKFCTVRAGFFVLVCCALLALIRIIRVLYPVFTAQKGLANRLFPMGKPWPGGKWSVGPEKKTIKNDCGETVL